MIVACIPSYNEEKTISRVIIQAQKNVDGVIVCDDGSDDMTGEIAERLSAIVLRHDRRMGYGSALKTLFKRSRMLNADVMVTLDADGQHDARAIPNLIEPIVRGEADIVIGSRFLDNRSAIPAYRKFGIDMITRFQDITSKNGITDSQSGFRAYSRKALSLLEPTECGMGASAELMMKAHQNHLTVKEVPIIVKHDVEDPSTHNPIYHGMDVIGSIIKHYSIRHSLLFYGFPGMFFAMMGIGFGLWSLDAYAHSRQLNLSLTLISIGSLIIGALMIATAVILFTLVSVVRESR
jgi:glycosyltransferase involved in cell wall biosynthesis